MSYLTFFVCLVSLFWFCILLLLANSTPDTVLIAVVPVSLLSKLLVNPYFSPFLRALPPPSVLNALCACCIAVTQICYYHHFGNSLCLLTIGSLYSDPDSFLHLDLCTYLSDNSTELKTLFPFQIFLNNFLTDRTPSFI